MSDKIIGKIVIACFIIVLIIVIVLTSDCKHNSTKKQTTDSTYVSQGHISNPGGGGR